MRVPPKAGEPRPRRHARGGMPGAPPLCPTTRRSPSASAAWAPHGGRSHAPGRPRSPAAPGVGRVTPGRHAVRCLRGLGASWPGSRAGFETLGLFLSDVTGIQLCRPRASLLPAGPPPPPPPLSVPVPRHFPPGADVTGVGEGAQLLHGAPGTAGPLPPLCCGHHPCRATRVAVPRPYLGRCHRCAVATSVPPLCWGHRHFCATPQHRAMATAAPPRPCSPPAPALWPAVRRPILFLLILILVLLHPMPGPPAREPPAAPSSSHPRPPRPPARLPRLCLVWPRQGQRWCKSRAGNWRRRRARVRPAQRCGGPAKANTRGRVSHRAGAPPAARPTPPRSHAHTHAGRRHTRGAARRTLVWCTLASWGARCQTVPHVHVGTCVAGACAVLHARGARRRHERRLARPQGLSQASSVSCTPAGSIAGVSSVSHARRGAARPHAAGSPRGGGRWAQGQPVPTAAGLARPEPGRPRGPSCVTGAWLLPGFQPSRQRVTGSGDVRGHRRAPPGLPSPGGLPTPGAPPSPVATSRAGGGSLRQRSCREARLRHAERCQLAGSILATGRDLCTTAS